VFLGEGSDIGEGKQSGRFYFGYNKHTPAIGEFPEYREEFI
jgi:hypothetical protein